MTESITAEELVLENISKLGKTIEKYSEEDFENDDVQYDLTMKLIGLDTLLSPLKDEKFNGVENKKINEFGYQDIVDQHRELSKLAFRAYSKNQRSDL